MAKTKKNLLLDAHAHIYPEYDLRRFLICAVSNLTDLHAQDVNNSDQVVQKGIILTERLSENYFQKLYDVQLELPFELKQIDNTCVEIKVNNDSLLVFAGRQIKTKEGLEIHVIASTDHFSDAESFSDTLKRLSELQLPLVLPWGFGKWLGKRAQIIFEACQQDHIILGDSLIRPRWWSCAALDQTNKRVLCGTDPLPWTGQEAVVGRYASLIKVEPEHASISTALCNSLKSEVSFERLGKRTVFKDTLRALQALM